MKQKTTVSAFKIAQNRKEERKTPGRWPGLWIDWKAFSLQGSDLKYKSKPQKALLLIASFSTPSKTPKETNKKPNPSKPTNKKQATPQTRN